MRGIQSACNGGDIGPPPRPPARAKSGGRQCRSARVFPWRPTLRRSRRRSSSLALRSAPPLRVPREGERGNTAQTLEGRPLRYLCQSATRQPYDGHTLATVIAEMEQQIGMTLNRILADAGYRGHNAPPEYRFKVYTGQKRRMTEHIRRQLRRRSAVEPVIGHLKRPPYGPQLSRTPPWRRQQRGACRRRLQLPPAAGMAQAFCPVVLYIMALSDQRACRPTPGQPGFFTADS